MLIVETGSVPGLDPFHVRASLNRPAFPPAVAAIWTLYPVVKIHILIKFELHRAQLHGRSGGIEAGRASFCSTDPTASARALGAAAKAVTTVSAKAMPLAPGSGRRMIVLFFNALLVP